MKKLLATLALSMLFSIAAHADSVIGNWSFPTQSDSGISFDMTMGIATNSLTMTLKCSFPDGVVAQNSVTTHAAVTADTITNLEAKESKGSDSTHSCDISSAVGTMTYVVMGNALTLTAPGQGSMTLTRAP